MTSWVPPGAQYGIMTMTVDAHGDAWFVEQNANYIGHFDKRQQTMTFFRLSLPSSAPFGLTLDPAGSLWFTAGGSSANYVGEMTP